MYSESAARPVSSSAYARMRARHCPSISAPPDISNNCAYQPRTPSHVYTHAHQPNDSVYAPTGATLHRVPPYLHRRTAISTSLGGDVVPGAGHLIEGCSKPSDWQMAKTAETTLCTSVSGVLQGVSAGLRRRHVLPSQGCRLFHDRFVAWLPLDL